MKVLSHCFDGVNYCFDLGGEAPLSFSEKEAETLPGDVMKAARMALGLVPEIRDPIDMVFLLGIELGVMDAKMPKAGYFQGVLILSEGLDDRRLGEKAQQENIAIFEAGEDAAEALETSEEAQPHPFQ